MTWTKYLPDFSERDYHADAYGEVPNLSASIARELVDKSPLHAQRLHPRLGGKKRADKDEFDRGKLAHLLLLGKGTGYEVCRVTYRDDHERSGETVSDWKTKNAQAWKKHVRDQGKIPVLLDELGAAEYMAKTWRSRLDALGIELSGESEVTIFWEDFGARCKARLDHVIRSEGVIYEIKTCESAHPRACRSHVESFGYDIQAEAYKRALEAIDPHSAGRVLFRWLFLEVNPPFDVTPCFPDGSMEQAGALRWEYACKRWAHCLATDTWPGYVHGPEPLEASPWHLSAAERLAEFSHPFTPDTEPAPPSPREEFHEDERALF